jgi:hypothetical protein
MNPNEGGGGARGLMDRACNISACTHACRARRAEEDVPVRARVVAAIAYDLGGFRVVVGCVSRTVV